MENFTRSQKPNNRKQLKEWFITFPQATLDAKDFHECLKQLDSVYIHTATETHKDGNKHFHSLIVLKNRTSKSKILKLFKEEYPNDYKRIDVKYMFNIEGAIQYVSKECKEPILYGQVPLKKQLLRNPSKSLRLTVFNGTRYQEYRKCIDSLISEMA